MVYYDVNFNHNYVRDTQIIRKKILAVAKIYKDTNIRFAVSNEEEYAEELKALGLHDANEDIKIGAYDRFYSIFQSELKPVYLDFLNWK